jgi:hypothetical protein
MVRATRTRRHEVISLPLRTVLASLRKKLLGLVDQTGATWNRIVRWLQQLQSLRRGADLSGAM